MALLFNTRVDNMTAEDWMKLTRLMRHFFVANHMVLILKIEDLSVVKWWVGMSHTANCDYQSQTGALMSLGAGS